MCGCYSFAKPESTVDWDLFFQQILDLPGLSPMYRVAPTTTNPIVVDRGAGKVIKLARWGLLPPWAKDMGGAPLINGRADTLAEKPSFKGALKARRCLVPASAFIEWETIGEGKTKQKNPKVFTMANGQPFMMAGLWEPWQGPEGILDTYSLITTEPNALVASIHDRMPVIIGQDAWGAWLDPEQKNVAAIQPLLAPFPAELMAMRAGNKKLNFAKNNDPSVLEPPEPDVPPSGQLSLFG